MSMAKKIETLLRQSLSISHLKVINESALHAGHAGDDGSGESHFKLFIVSDDFLGLNRVARHRKIYHILDDLMKKHIHALAIEALNPSEFQPKDTF